MSTLSGKTALITGASSGIGLATANMLTEKGVRVIGCARRKEALNQAMQALPGESLAATLDVADTQSVNMLLSRLPEDWREIDILINNAGSDVGGRQRFDQGRLQDWLGTIETNVSGLMQVSALLLPGMLDRGDGHIVNIGSTQGLTGVAGCAAYAASKHAVHGFSETLRQEYAGKGIRVSEVLPGMVRTEFAATRFSSEERGRTFYDDYGQSLEADDIARCIVFALEQPPHAVVSQIVMVPDHA